MAKISVIGTGYVGLVSGTLLSDFGHDVICVDIDQEKIEQLKKGIIPIFEPGLSDIIARNVQSKRLSFSTDIYDAVQKSEIIFIAVGTPPDEDGRADLQYVLSAAGTIARAMNEYKVIVNKSTVPIGTGKKVKTAIQTILNERKVGFSFDIISNPEFLREGSAVQDFSHPDRIVLGYENMEALEKMRNVYRVLYINETPFVETNLETAEMIKYAANAFLAVKITYINEIANLCEKVGANVQQVAKAMGQDGRISPKFLHAGPGFGGSCFPKDSHALAQIGRDHHQSMPLIETVIQANEEQKKRMVEKIITKMGSLKGKTLAILGITFKPNTDDMREAPSMTILPALMNQGANLRLYDPQGQKEAIWRLKKWRDQWIYCQDEYEAIETADAIVLLTEWNCFRNLDMPRVRSSMRGRYFFDLRNVYNRLYMEKQGFIYEGVGQ